MAKLTIFLLAAASTIAPSIAEETSETYVIAKIPEKTLLAKLKGIQIIPKFKFYFLMY